MIIRLTDKMAKKIKEAALPTIPPGTNPFVDWTARLFTADRTQYVLVSNTATLYSIVFYGKGITDANQLINRMLDTMRDVMKHDGFESIYEERIAPATGEFSFSRTGNRSVTGSMNDLVFGAKWHLIRDEMSPYDVSFRLNKTPFSYLKHAYPRDTFGFMAPELQRSNTKGNVIPFPGTPRVNDSYEKDTQDR